MYIPEVHSSDQWVSDGYAIYPLYTLPEFTPENLAEMYGITKKKQKEMSFKTIRNFPESLNFADMVKNEEMLLSYGFTFTSAGEVIEPFSTESGMPYFVNTDHLTPFADMQDIDLYLRFSETGSPYIAVKQGMLLHGIILPIMLLKENFITKLSNFAVDCKSAYDTAAVFDRKEVEDGNEQPKL